MGRRGENIRKRNDGRWEARAVCGPPVDGKTNYKYLYSSTYQEAKALKKEFLLNLEAIQKSAPASPAPPFSAESTAKEPAAKKSAVKESAAKESVAEESAAKSSVEEDSAAKGSAAKKSVEEESAAKMNAGNASIVLAEEEEMLSDYHLPEKIQKSLPSFSDVAHEWLASKKLSVKKSTFANYAFVVEKHLLPDLGNLAIKDLDTDRMDAFLLGKKAHGGIRNGGPLSEKTLSQIKGTLNRVLRYAKSRSIIESVPDSMPVSVKQPPIQILTKQEQEAIEAKALSEDTLFSMGVLLCLNTGIREGELCGLQWGDFDWEEETISISKTVYRISNMDNEAGPRTRVVIDKPKTVCSIRTIPLPPETVQYFKDRAGAASEYVVTGTEKFMEPRVCRDRYARFEKRAGVAHHTFHTLRHTYSTNCVEDGVNTKVLSENLGHSDVSITLQLYVHPSMKTKKAEVTKLKTFMNCSQN